MKNMSRHTTERVPLTAPPTKLRVTLYVSLHLIAGRSVGPIGFWTALVSFLFAGPAIWRWRKYAPFPRGVRRKMPKALAGVYF